MLTQSSTASSCVSSVDSFNTCPPSYSRSRSWKRNLLTSAYNRGVWDRVNVLGSDSTGHTGCVNALSWAKGGEILISSGDDRTIRLWSRDRDCVDHDYPFVYNTVIGTGHHANVFSAQMLPHSSRIATAAGDRQVRVFDHEKAAGNPAVTGEIEYSTHAAIIRVLRCHSGRVKRIVTEDSPDLFLTVSEDGSVRQHDLRIPHSCNADTCPMPLLQLGHELSTIALSPLTPYQFVVAGSSSYGYLFDRRHAGRQFEEEWGVPPDSRQVTNCVRRFGRTNRGQYERRGLEHVTGARMASSNGHEVLLSYSADAIYLYSTKDDPPPTSMATEETSIVSPNQERSLDRRSSGSVSIIDFEDNRDVGTDEDIERILAETSKSTEEHRPLLDSGIGDEDLDIREDDEDTETSSLNDEDEAGLDDPHSNIPTVLPRSRFEGVCNVETVKDVNFLGPRDEFVVSGSDDGHWFMWEKETGRLHDILEGDCSVVNVIEGHPHLPLVAVSGIDYTVKLFAPTLGPSHFSRVDKAAAIMSRNVQAASPRRSTLSNVVLYYRLARRMAEEGHTIDPPECTFQ